MNKKKTVKEKISSKHRKNQSHEYETMSQIQNRYGKGREKNGSDGGSNEGRGSNHCILNHLNFCLWQKKPEDRTQTKIVVASSPDQMTISGKTWGTKEVQPTEATPPR